jgi:phasin
MFAACDPHVPVANPTQRTVFPLRITYATLLTPLESAGRAYHYGGGNGNIFLEGACRTPRADDPVPRGTGQSGADAACNYANVRRTTLEKAIMIEPKLEVPAELRDLAEKTIDQAEKAFGMFFDAAGKSMTSMPGAGTEISRQALSFTEQNMKAAFEHARKLVHATDLQEAMRIQSEFLRSQFTNAGEHMRQITGGVMSAAKDASKGKF